MRIVMYKRGSFVVVVVIITSVMSIVIRCNNDEYDDVGFGYNNNNNTPRRNPTTLLPIASVSIIATPLEYNVFVIPLEHYTRHTL